VFPELYARFGSSLEAHGFGFLRVFNFVTFQSAFAVLLSFLIVIFLGKPVVGWLRSRKIGDNPDFDRADMNAIMADKRGTPTMGGLLIIGAILLTTLLVADLHNYYVWLAIVCVSLLALLGATDDWIKLNRHRLAAKGKEIASRQGLTGKEKLVAQIVLGLVISWLTYNYGSELPQNSRLYFPFFKEDSGVWLQLSPIAYVLFSTFIITGVSNAVNLTDGLDGLASGCTSLVGFVLLVFGIIIGDEQLAKMLLYPYLPAGSQLAVMAGAISGASLGFLWFNCNPARVFMGDTGSLALGGLLGYIAIVIRQEILLAIVGAVFVAEALSVMMQISYFKLTRKLTGEGKRIFKMSPLHHHFQKCGWSETQVVVRFWLVGAMLAAFAVATIRLR
jgi:phospho-N-acetylmuramoyl-pentapeptide-transferase